MVPEQPPTLWRLCWLSPRALQGLARLSPSLFQTRTLNLRQRSCHLPKVMQAVKGWSQDSEPGLPGPKPCARSRCPWDELQQAVAGQLRVPHCTAALQALKDSHRAPASCPQTFRCSALFLSFPSCGIRSPSRPGYSLWTLKVYQHIPGAFPPIREHEGQQVGASGTFLEGKTSQELKLRQEQPACEVVSSLWWNICE